MSNLSKITDSSLIKAMFKSRCVFITFAASATLIDEAGKVPADIMLLYRSSISLAVSCVEPLVIFLILVRVFTLSPGLTSQDYNHKNLIKFDTR